MRNYIPDRDVDFGTWLDNFSSVLTATPAAYGLLASDAVTVNAVRVAWDAAYTAATGPSTRTPDTIQAKNTAKLNALATVRPYAQQIASNVGVSSALKIAIGVNPRTNPPTPVTAPTTNPTLSVPSMINLGHVVRYRDSLASPTVKAKPAGAVAMEYYNTVSATPITDPTLLTFDSLQTKAPFTKAYGTGDVGKQAYMAGRWVTRKGLVGPWGPIIHATVPG